jgi:hypothetical protein
MLAQNDIRARHSIKQPVGDHPLGASSGLFSRLEHRDEGPGPVRTRCCQFAGRAEQARDVHVVAASVHHAVNLARVFKPGRLLDRQGVHVRSEQHGRPVAVAEHPSHPGRGDALDDLIVKVLQPRRGDPRRAMLLERQFRMSVKIPVYIAEATSLIICHVLSVYRQ